MSVELSRHQNAERSERMRPASTLAVSSAWLASCSAESLDVYSIGDGAAMSGVLLAARRPPEGALFLVFLLD